MAQLTAFCCLFINSNEDFRRAIHDDAGSSNVKLALMVMLLRRLMLAAASTAFVGCGPSIPVSQSPAEGIAYTAMKQAYFGALPTERSVKGRMGLTMRASGVDKVEILEVGASSAAAAAGLKTGDVIARFNGGPGTMVRILRYVAKNPGATVRLLIERDGFRKEVPLTVEAADQPGPCVVVDEADAYMGECLNGLAHGYGKYVNAQMLYIGQLQNGLPHGVGKRTSKNDQFYEGNFKEGDYAGHGEYSHRGESYEGQWKDGLLDGKARYKTVDGKVYEGVWRKGVNQDLQRRLQQERLARQEAQQQERARAESEASESNREFLSTLMAVMGAVSESMAEENQASQASLDEAIRRARESGASQQQRIAPQPQVARPPATRESSSDNPERARQQAQARELAQQRDLVRQQAQEQAAQRRRDYLGRMEDAIALRATNCGGRPALAGSVPGIRPREVSCLKLSYEVRCGEGAPVFDSGSTNHWIGYSCLGIGEARYVNNSGNCPVAQMRVNVTEVESCR